MDTEYNGHESKGHWNVALWIGNDEPLYRFAQECLRGRSLQEATSRFLAIMGDEKTPDGFKYTRTRVRAALKGLME